MSEIARNAVINYYGGGKHWKEKVKNMTDSQVTAIYLRLKAQGKIN